MKYVIHKNSHVPNHESYRGTTWDSAGIRNHYKVFYENKVIAEKIATILSKYNPVGFRVSERKLFTKTNEFPDLLELVAYSKEICNTIEKLEAYQYYPSACGCMGPKDKWTYCHCRLCSCIAKHKSAIIAARLKET